MGRYNGWRELRIQSGYDRRKLVRKQRILFFGGIFLAVILLAVGSVHLWKRMHTPDEGDVKDLAVLDVTPQPTIIPTTPPTPAPTEEPIKVVVEEVSGCIILDAGHGGIDGGTFCNEVLEKNINFAVVTYMKDLLEEAGVKIILTRSGDDFMNVSERAGFVNENKDGVDLFVSIHCNYFEDDDSVSGLECYYYTGDEEGQACAEGMIESLKKCEDIKVRSAKHGGYYVLKFTEIPAVLVEMGFLSNTAEREKLNSEQYQKLLAQELTKGIIDYLKDIPETVAK